MLTATLPIESLKPDVLSHWRTGGAIVSAPPGSGKTTQLPLWLLPESDHAIYVLIPKRIAVKLAAEQLSRNIEQAVGQTVGYILRNDRLVSTSTQIFVTTYGTFLQLLINDPDSLTRSTVIFDEFHERNLDQDLCYALVNHLTEHLDDSIKRIIMSATMDSETMVKQTGLPLLQSEGRSFPVTISYRKTDIMNSNAVAAFIESIWQQDDDHLLVFCAGIAQMRSIENHLSAACPVLLLHSQLTKTPNLTQLISATKTIILATNIAESSITLPRVHTVIDLGTERFVDVHPVTGVSELKTRRISRASATQRSGRAGRLQPGQAWRLWSEDEHQSLTAFQAPEVLQADLTHLVLNCLAWGADREELNWLDQPPAGRWQSAVQRLKSWQAITDHGAVTSHGERMQRLGIEPWLAHLLSCALKENCIASAAIFAAHLTLNQPFNYSPFAETGVHHFSQDIRSEAANLCKRFNTSLATMIPALKAEFLIHAAPDRLIFWHDSQHGKYYSGIETFRRDPQKAGWALLLSGHKKAKQLLVHHSLSVSEESVRSVLPTVKTCQFHPKANAQFTEVTQIGAIVLNTQAIQPSTNEKENAWREYIQQQGEAAFHWSEKDHQLKSRWLFACFLNEHFPSWPIKEDWVHLVMPFLPGLNRLSDLPIIDVLNSHLGYDNIKWLEEQIPATWQAPSDRAVNIHYDVTNRKAVVELKLQEAFGLTQQPTLASHHPITLNLLAPNGRPVASVTDVSHFWHSVYPDVRKELRGRYAKHPWPEDPISSAATTKTNRQLRS